MSNWKPEVEVSGAYNQNSLVFATQEEALANARDLYSRWMLCTNYRAVPSDDPVNYKWDPQKGLVALAE